MTAGTAVAAFFLIARVAFSQEGASAASGLVLLQRNAGIVATPSVDVHSPLPAGAPPHQVASHAANSSSSEDDAGSGGGAGKKSSFLYRPRMLVMGGCSGSSFLMNTAHKLMELHGVHGVYFEDGGEMLKPDKNKFFTEEEGMGHAMVLAQQDAERRGGSLFFKAMTTVLTDTRKGVAWSEVAPSLKDMGTFVVYGVRENALDRAVCEVRDCFTENYGKPVDGNTGQRSHLCFKRRSSPEVKYQAEMKAGKLVKAIRRLEESVETEQQILRESGFDNFHTVSMEDLTAYQYGNSYLEKSVSAWAIFLNSWGVQPKQNAIKAHLSSELSSTQKSAPGPHREVIYNIDEVADALADAGMSKYLRT